MGKFVRIARACFERSGMTPSVCHGRKNNLMAQIFKLTHYLRGDGVDFESEFHHTSQTARWVEARLAGTLPGKKRKGNHRERIQRRKRRYVR